MSGPRWNEVSAALTAVAPICAQYDHFINHRNPRTSSGAYENIKTTIGVESIFQSVRPMGTTRTGSRLRDILKPYLTQLKRSLELQARVETVSVKPLNIIVITDGVPTDDVEDPIVACAKKLDAWEAISSQVGIQFFQIGSEPDAAEDLQELDDALSERHRVRDMVDTVPWDGETLTDDKILKVTLGSVVRRLDRKR